MNTQVAKFIVQELGVGRLYEEYSGRGMFGDTTTGIIVDSLSDVYEVVFGFISSEADYILGDLDTPVKDYIDELTDIKLLATELKDGIRWDNMGGDVIVY